MTSAGAGKPFTAIVPTAPQRLDYITSSDLDYRSCGACYRPVFQAGYCASCREKGYAARHAANRLAEAPRGQ